MKVVPVSVQNTVQNTVQNNINPDSNSDSISTPPSDFGNILKYVKGKFPAFILFLHIYIEFNYFQFGYPKDVYKNYYFLLNRHECLLLKPYNHLIL